MRPGSSRRGRVGRPFAGVPVSAGVSRRRLPPQCRLQVGEKGIQTRLLLGGKSRNKVAVGEPAAGSPFVVHRCCRCRDDEGRPNVGWMVASSLLQLCLGCSLAPKPPLRGGGNQRYGRNG